MPRLTVRIDFDQHRAIGPGKIKLLELIDALGSISAAGRRMNMSYRRAWLLVDNLNGSFREPLVASQTGGAHGGGASLTPAGAAVVRHYRAIEAAAHAAGTAHIEALQAALADVTPEPERGSVPRNSAPRLSVSEKRAAGRTRAASSGTSAPADRADCP